MLLAINNINVAQNQIAETFKRMDTEFEALPKSAIGQFFRELIKTGYLDEKDNEYNEIQEYFSLYIQSTRMLAGAYIVPIPCHELNAKTAGMTGKDNTVEIGQQLVRLVQPLRLEKRSRIHEFHILRHSFRSLGYFLQSIFALHASDIRVSVSNAAGFGDPAEGKPVCRYGQQSIVRDGSIIAASPQGDADLRKKISPIFRIILFHSVHSLNCILIK